MRMFGGRDFAKDCVPMPMFEKCGSCGEDRLSLTMLTIYGRNICARCSGLTKVQIETARGPIPMRRKERLTIEDARKIRADWRGGNGMNRKQLQVKWGIAEGTLRLLLADRTFKEPVPA